VGLLVLVGSTAAVSLSLLPRTRADGPSTGGKPDRQSVAVAYVDVEGGVRSLYPTQAGRIVSLPKSEGQSAKKGEVLLKIDDSLARALLKEAKSDLKAAKEKLAEARKLGPQHQQKIAIQQRAIEAARKDLAAAEAKAREVERWYKSDLGGTAEGVEAAKSLAAKAKEGVMAEQEKLALLKMVDPEAAVRLAQTDVEHKNEVVKKAQLAVDECEVKAPCDGKILRCFVNEGEVFSLSSQRPAIQFAPAGGLIVRAEVEQEFATQIKKGQSATIEDDVATNSAKWYGQVTQISDWYTQRRAVLMEPLQFNDMRTLEVIIKVKSGPSEQPLRIGQKERVRVQPG